MVSWVWKHFTRVGNDKARCTVNQCDKLLSSKGGSTSSLAAHLRIVHKIGENGTISEADTTSTTTTQPQAQQSVSGTQKPKRQRTIVDYTKFSTLEETVARLACETNLTLRQIAKCQYLRKCFTRDFPTSMIPLCQKGVMKLIMKHYANVKSKTITRIRLLLDKGKKFSATLDEWTSLKNVRYLNVNVHYNHEAKTEFINLGMITIKGSCPAPAMVKLVSLVDTFRTSI